MFQKLPKKIIQKLILKRVITEIDGGAGSVWIRCRKCFDKVVEGILIGNTQIFYANTKYKTVLFETLYSETFDLMKRQITQFRTTFNYISTLFRFMLTIINALLNAAKRSSNYYFQNNHFVLKGSTQTINNKRTKF